MWKGAGPAGGPTAIRNSKRGLIEAQVLMLPTPRTSDTNGPGLHGDGGLDLRTAVTLLPTPAAGVFNDGETVEQWDARRERVKAKGINGNGMGEPLAIAAKRLTDWGPYEAAIRRWENVLGRPAPAPTEPNAKGNPRLSPRFTEWLMGVPDGWICDTPGVSRNDQLKAAGNGVVPQQAAEALRDMLASFAADDLMRSA
jgi:DNA (cytosine-5)-methyltransferase 1